MPLIEYRQDPPADDQYRQLLIQNLERGEEQRPLNKPERPSTFSLPGGARMMFDLRNGFPLLGYRYLSPDSWRALVVELLWFLSGSTNLYDLQRQGVTLWDFCYDEQLRLKYNRQPGDLGPIYGEQWRRFKGPDGKWVDQIARLIAGIKADPDSKAHYVSAWHPTELMEPDGTPRTRPVNCHTAFQVSHFNGYLDLALNQRSGDAPIGIPFNIASYSLLLMMFAQVTGFKPRYFVHTINNFHYYANQREFVEKLVRREPMPFGHVYLNPAVHNIDFFTEHDVFLEGYRAWPLMKVPVTA